MANRIQLRRDTTANWNTVNPVLSDGEPGLETDTGKVKYGDGTTPWQALPYASGGSGSGGLSDRLIKDSYSVILGDDGTLTLPGDIKNGTAGLSFPSGGVYLTTNLDDDNNALYFDHISHDAQLYVGGNITLSTAVVPGDSELDWTFGADGILKMPPGNETTAGWIQWSHADDDLTNVAGAGFVDYFNAYTGLGLTAPTDTNAEKGIWFGTPADPTSPFQPETSMVFRNDTLYLPKNGYIKSHDINRVGYANLTTVGTTITIQTNDEYDWVFGTDGILTLPFGSTINDTPAAPGNGNGQAVEIKPGGASHNNQLLRIYPTVVNPDGNHLHLTSGDLSDTDLFLGDDDQFVQIAADGNVCIGTNNASNIWQFGTDGGLTLPSGGIIKDSTGTNILDGLGGISANDFGDGFSLDGNNKVVTRKLYSTDPNNASTHYRLELTTGGTIKLPDSSEIIGSTLKGIHGTGELNYTGLTIGPSSGNSENTWMYVDAYDAYIATDYANNAYTWKFDRNGNLTIPGEIRSATTTGPVAIQSNDGNNTRTWTFGTDGTLTFPDSTTQSTAYKRTTGSWTVATGSATYSFTVPSNGTYAMWVKGSITNGIIAWNATATVINNNVPVIGQQFAWNYTGGGTPIEITAIPTQFVGTANTIVSSNPSVGTTSNKFDFIINNTSGSAQTVYWGYVAQ